MYTISIYASRMPIPIQFAVHTWIITDFDGKKDRFEVFGFKEERGERLGHFYKNFNPPFQGCPVFALGGWRIFEGSFVWKTEILYEIKGAVHSEAAAVYKLLHNEYEELPFIAKYRLIKGPNSNSFTQWVLDRVAPGKYPLPWKAYGKNWRGE